MGLPGCVELGHKIRVGTADFDSFVIAIISYKFSIENFRKCKKLGKSSLRKVATMEDSASLSLFPWVNLCYVCRIWYLPSPSQSLKFLKSLS